MLTRTLLLLLSAFFLSWSVDHIDQIDWNQCGMSTICFIRESCAELSQRDLAAKNTLYLFDFGKGKLLNGICDVVIQVRIYSRTKWHVMIQVNATDSTAKLGSSEVSLKQGATQFGCKDNKPIGDTTIFDIVSRKGSKFDENIVFCTFTFEIQAGSKISSNYDDNTAFPTFEYTLDSLQSITYSSNKETLWSVHQTEKCNPELISTVDYSTGVYRQEKIDIYAYSPISCGSSENMIITRADSTKEALEKESKLSCKVDVWTYMKNSNSIAIPEGEKFNVVCAEKFCSRCPPLGNIEIAGGSNPTNGISNEGCVTTTCTDNPWMIDGARVLNGSMKCEKDEGPEKTSSWYLKTANESIKVTKASCVDTRICMNNFDPVEKCPDSPPMVCQTRKTSADGSEFSCTNDFKLKWMASGSSPAETASIKCDFTSGKFVDEKGNQLPRGSSVFCTMPGPPIEKPDKGGEAEERTATGSAGPIVGGVVGGIGGLLLLGLIVFLIVKIVIWRREVAYQAWLDQPLRKVDEADLIFMPILRTPEQDLGYKKHTVEVEEQRLPWDQRPRDLPELVPSALCLGHFDNGTFDQIILKEFIQYNPENKKKVFNNIAKMGAYSEDKEVNTASGTFAQFWKFFDMCVMRNMDSIDVWEMIFRMVRVFLGRLTDRKIFGTKYKTGYTVTFENRIKMVMIRFAKPILNCLGWTRKTTDSPTDVWMRFFVVRVLMWANEASVIAELERQADLPIEELESPMRAIVIGFANARLGRCRELYRKNWQISVDNPEDPTKDEYGTIRQHLMFGLTMAEKSARGIRQMDMVLDYCFDFAAIYSPVDMYWAYSGATEQFESGIEAIDHFVDTLPKALSFWREDQLRDLCKTKSDSEKAAIKNDWMRASHKTLNVLAESTCYDHQYKGMEKVVKSTLKYYDTMPADGHEHNPIMMKERIDNFALRFWDKKKEVEQEFSNALEWAERSNGPKKDTSRKYGF